MENHIPKIVLTGGPCAGKTSAKDFLSVKLHEAGFTPYFVPEAPTILMTEGHHPRHGLRAFQEQVIDLILSLEAKYETKAMRETRPILVCDRGIIDTLAYTPHDMFVDIIRSRGLDPKSVRDERYDAVIHLRSAAVGAEAFYTNENNHTRLETLDEAREADHRTLEAWLGHSRLRVVGNDGDFSNKLDATWRTLRHLLGIPEHLEIERRFLVESIELASVTPVHPVEIEQCYLRSDGETVRRIRKCVSWGGVTYYETVKKEFRPGVTEEKERVISSARYLQLMKERDPRTIPIRKTRNYFVYKDQYFELDRFKDAHEGLSILEIELVHENDPVSLPPFIRVKEEVTGRREWSNRALAER